MLEFRKRLTAAMALRELSDWLTLECRGSFLEHGKGPCNDFSDSSAFAKLILSVPVCRIWQNKCVEAQIIH